MSHKHKTIAQRVTPPAPKRLGIVAGGAKEVIDLHIPSVLVATEALAAHLAIRPVPGAPGYTKWVDDRYKLQTSLEMAKSAKGNSWQTIYQVESEIQPEPKRSASNPKLTIEDRVKAYNQHLANMSKLDSSSAQWETERQALHRQRRSMRESGYGVPSNLQPVPAPHRRDAA
jgi:hypothetical protein